MSVRIQLDNPHTFYTNLDFISGRIVLQLTNDENVSAIHVKLEGESRTLLMRPHPGPQPQTYGQRPQRQGLAMENHKILYKVNQVFPSQDATGSMGGAYTLRAGKHEYPFRFKMPFNNSCSDPQAQQIGPGSGFGGFGLGSLQQMQYRHVKKTLPPSLTGFPGEAEIRYYVKVTVARPSLFKENRRSAIGFKFLPIEPPRVPETTNETFARRPYVFAAGLAPVAKKSSFFKKNPTPLSDTAPKGEVDARLPSPAILTCNEPLPLRLIVRKTGESAESVFLTSLQVQLFGTTEVRAQDVQRQETSTWVLMNLSGLTMEIGKPSDELRTETVINKELWDQIPLPNTITPTFHTCNISRTYELEIRVGLGFGVVGEIQPQIVTLPLRFRVEIYSGIKPPANLLDAMASQPPQIPLRPSNLSSQASQSQNQQPAYDPIYPPQLPPGANPVNDAPPSYEDAMAEEISPADGPRREYSGVTDVNAPGLDEKGGGIASGGMSGTGNSGPQPLPGNSPTGTGTGPGGGRNGDGSGSRSAVV